ncbi:MAG TPA: fatty acid desaturase [Bdellovibrionota bacterium]|jgi:stearoyl-CoA desaturase (delta-9 desaturase)
METKFQHNPHWNGSISWGNVIFLISTPLLMFALFPVMIFHYGLHWSDFAIFSVMIFTTGFAVTVGYHRLFAHQTFEAHPLVRFLLLFFGAGCVENSALKWASDHRYHHRFVDKDGDPYNINRGFFYAHMGWIFFNDPPGRTLENAPDLAADPLVKWQHKYYLPLCVFVAFLLPTLMGLAIGRPLAGFFWGGLFRTLFLQHGTFLVNSACHMFGNRPYSTKVTARDCWWLAPLTNGEGYHNFHHAFGSDYRNGVRWFHWDPSKWMIRGLSFVGLTYNLKRTPDAIILKARLETSYEEFRNGWKSKEVPVQLEQMREALEEKLQDFQQKFREFQAWKETKVAEGARFRRSRARLWKRKLRRERQALEAAVSEFRELLRTVEVTGSAAFA